MNQTSELLFYFVCMESFRYTQACAGVPEEVFQMSYPEVDFLYLNEEDMVAAGVKDMAGCIDAMEEMFKLMKVGDYRMGGANGNSHGCMVMFPPSSPFPEMPVEHFAVRVAALQHDLADGQRAVPHQAYSLGDPFFLDILGKAFTAMPFQQSA